jgi:hypothetical protein
VQEVLSLAKRRGTGPVTPNPAVTPTVQQRHFACCCPAGYREHWASGFTANLEQKGLQEPYRTLIRYAAIPSK